MHGPGGQQRIVSRNAWVAASSIGLRLFIDYNAIDFLRKFAGDCPIEKVMQDGMRAHDPKDRHSRYRP